MISWNVLCPQLCTELIFPHSRLQVAGHGLGFRAPGAGVKVHKVWFWDSSKFPALFNLEIKKRKKSGTVEIETWLQGLGLRVQG